MQLYQLSFPNGKKYIGITSKTVNERFKEHCKPAHNKNPCQKAIHKYGKENVVLTVLATVDNWELLCLAEMEAIEKFNSFAPNGYNLTLGGNGHLTVGIYGEDRVNRDKARIAARTKLYREKNCEIIATNRKNLREKNSESIAAKDKEYRKNNRAILAAKYKVRYEANREKNREKVAAKNKAYNENNKEMVAAKRKAYRDAKKKAVMDAVFGGVAHGN